jgi:hypothetical protein
MERARTKPGRVEAKADSLVWLPGWSDMWGWQFVSLNKEKNLGMWLGRWRACSSEPVDLKWTSDFQKSVKGLPGKLFLNSAGEGYRLEEKVLTCKLWCAAPIGT